MRVSSSAEPVPRAFGLTRLAEDELLRGSRAWSRCVFLSSHFDRGLRMSRIHAAALSACGLLLLACTTTPPAETPATSAPVANTPAAAAPMESARAESGGGISVSGWTGRVDANEAKQGQVLNNAKLVSNGGALHVTTGPAVAYWSPSNTASGDYTVSATF